MNPDDEPLFKAFIGPGWERHYRAAFEQAAAGRSFGWNWAAALVPGWLAYRRFVLGQVLAWIGLMFALLFVLIIAQDHPVPGYAGVALVLAGMGALQGFMADATLFRRARQLMAHKGFPADPAARHAWMARRGGWSALGPAVAVGFLGVVVWAIIYPKLGHDHHERPMLVMMRSDLRNLVTYEESYFADYVRYTTLLRDAARADTAAWAVFTPTPGVVVTIDSASGTGWAASARDSEGRWHCVIFVGDVPPRPLEGVNMTLIAEGEPKCARLSTTSGGAHDAH